MQGSGLSQPRCALLVIMGMAAITGAAHRDLPPLSDACQLQHTLRCIGELLSRPDCMLQACVWAHKASMGCTRCDVFLHAAGTGHGVGQLMQLIRPHKESTTLTCSMALQVLFVTPC